MACLVPRTVVNPRYKKIAPNNHAFLYHCDYGQIPKKDYFVDVGCGRCINCFKKYMSAWRFRLLHECLSYTPAELSRSYFVTLTIEPRHYTQNKTKLKRMVRLFLERVRKDLGHSIKHFLVTERGEEKGRLHFHGFFFNTDLHPNKLYHYWRYGFVKVRSLSDREYPVSQRVSYCTSYVTKGKKGVIPDIIPPEDYPLVLVSPGLGKAYVDKYSHIHNRDVLFPLAFDINGALRSLPRYLRQKVFDDSALKELKDNYFDNLSEDVIPEPPYYIGNKVYQDYTLFKKDLIPIVNKYRLIYG